MFLPAAGLRYFYSGELTNFNWIGYYQSSSLGTDGNAYNPYSVAFHANILAPAVLTLASNNSQLGSVTLNSGNTLPEGVIAGVTEGTFHVIPGTQVTLNATANQGFHLKGWRYGTDNSCGGCWLSNNQPENPLQLTVTSDTNITAVFDTNSYDITASVAQTTDVRGTVKIDYTDTQGQNKSAGPAATAQASTLGDSTSTLTATPSTYYHFLEWNDDNTDNPRMVSLVSDSTFTAYFAPDTFTITYMDGTEELKVEKVPYRESIPEYIPTKPGMKFMGWNPALPQLMPSENLTTYAQ